MGYEVVSASRTAPAAFTGRAVSDNVGISKGHCESTPRAQSLSKGALTGNIDQRIGMITSGQRLPERHPRDVGWALAHLQKRSTDVNIPMLTAALPVSAPFEVLRPGQPLVSRLGYRKTVKDGTSGERGPFPSALPARSHPSHCLPAGSPVRRRVRDQTM